MSEAGNTGAENRGLVLTRVFEAPRELVFRAWTSQEHFMHWFGPRDVEMVECKIDPQPGGIIQFCHKLQDGIMVRVKGKFLKVESPEFLAFATSFVDEQGRPGILPMFPDYPLETVMTTTVSLKEIADGTKMTVRQTIAPPEAEQHDAVRKERNLARMGWGETFERLEEYLASLG